MFTYWDICLCKLLFYFSNLYDELPIILKYIKVLGPNTPFTCQSISSVIFYPRGFLNYRTKDQIVISNLSILRNDLILYYVPYSRVRSYHMVYLFISWCTKVLALDIRC